MARILLNDDDWLVTSGPLGGISVTLKHRGMRIKASRPESMHLVKTFEALSAKGIPIEPENSVVKSVLEEFAEALFSRGGARWRAYFSTSPEEIADEQDITPDT